MIGGRLGIQRFQLGQSSKDSLSINLAEVETYLTMNIDGIEYYLTFDLN